VMACLVIVAVQSASQRRARLRRLLVNPGTTWPRQAADGTAGRCTMAVVEVTTG
jgi:hypothetical protein